MASARWRAAIEARFGERPDFGLDSATSLFCAEGDLPQNEVSELLRTIEQEYGVSAGLLRPNDPLDHLTTPVPVRNPLRDVFYRYWSDEHWGEINYQLGKRLHRRGKPNFRAGVLRSLGDLAWAWCGRLGADGERSVSAT